MFITPPSETRTSETVADIAVSSTLRLRHQKRSVVKQRKPALDVKSKLQVVGLTRSQKSPFTGSSRGKFHPGETHFLRIGNMPNILKQTSLAVTGTEPSNSFAPSIVTKADVSLDVDAIDTVVIKGNVIPRSANGLFSLNAIQKALGGSEARNPYEFFRRKGVEEFVMRVEQDFGAGVLETVTSGERQGTYAHELIAQKYATFVDEDYELLVHVVFRAEEVRQKRAMQLELAKEREEKLEWKERANDAEYGMSVRERQLKEKEQALAFTRSTRADRREGGYAAAHEAASNLLREATDSKREAVPKMHLALSAIDRCLARLAKDDHRPLIAANEAKRYLNEALQSLAPETLD